MSNVAILLADGFEPIEALAPADALRRAGVNVTLVTINADNNVHAAHEVNVVADEVLDAYDFDTCDLIVLPGGQPGTTNLRADERVCNLVREFMANKKLAAICAAPSILAELGLLEGRFATCYPGCDKAFPAGVRPEASGVYVDGNLITASGPGLALPFGIELIRVLCDDEKAAYVAKGMLFEV